MSTVSKKIVYQAKYFKVEQRVIERNGKIFTKDLIIRNASVHIIPYTANNEIYMESQFRDALGGLSLEVVAGTIEEGDDPLETAKRELSEETGLRAKKWEKIAEWNLSVNMVSKVYVYAATELEEGIAHVEDDEEIDVIKMPLDEVMRKITIGEMNTSSMIADIFLFKQLREEGKL